MKYSRLHKCRLPQDDPYDLSLETGIGHGTSTGSKQSGDDTHKVKGLAKAMERVMKTRELRYKQQQQPSNVGDN
ncbi:hypothetical protein Acr_00g0082970 [Actinidia rufa]|uniref:Uncharacterized protein n=1 Tax=Actinidia rufa TaxID=165716 RepID=A0A7J0DVE0_9ERIC|nr:hypothetical protein Acr_00g0082970 [Actinidia rufa]